MLNLLLTIAAIVLAVFGIINIVNGAILWGVVLLIAAALVGPGGYSLAHR